MKPDIAERIVQRQSRSYQVGPDYVIDADVGPDLATCLEAKEEIERLRANVERLTSNPTDLRYWEGRYRDEVEAMKNLEAENHRLIRKSTYHEQEIERLRAALVAVRDCPEFDLHDRAWEMRRIAERALGDE